MYTYLYICIIGFNHPERGVPSFKAKLRRKMSLATDQSYSGADVHQRSLNRSILQAHGIFQDLG